MRKIFVLHSYTLYPCRTKQCNVIYLKYLPVFCNLGAIYINRMIWNDLKQIYQIFHYHPRLKASESPFQSLIDHLRGNIPKCPTLISFIHLSFDRGPRVCVNPRRISADDFSFERYDHFIDFWICIVRYMQKMNCWVSVWYFVHR